jgi:hypothetical protein
MATEKLFRIFYGHQPSYKTDAMRNGDRPKDNTSDVPQHPPKILFISAVVPASKES